MTTRDNELISDITGHPSYKALIRLLEEDEQILLSKLERSQGEEAHERLLTWKAHRRIAKILAERPLALRLEYGADSEVS